jgi:vacuolar-type H+-ATPase subunit H
VHDGIPQTFAALKLRLDTKANDKKIEDEAKEKAKKEKDEAVKKLEEEAEELKKKIAKEEKHQEVGVSEPVVIVASVSAEEGVSRYLDTTL